MSQEYKLEIIIRDTEGDGVEFLIPAEQEKYPTWVFAYAMHGIENVLHGPCMSCGKRAVDEIVLVHDECEHSAEYEIGVPMCAECLELFESDPAFPGTLKLRAIQAIDDHGICPSCETLVTKDLKAAESPVLS